MKKIACVGYHGTGAGVIDDLFREFDNVYHGSYEAEVRLLHDPDGISDLEYHLVDNPHRLGTGVAIKRFIHYAKMQERQATKIFGNQWMDMVISYAEDLALIKYKGYISGDLQFVPFYIKLELYAKMIINKLKPYKFRKASWYNFLPNLETYYSLLSEQEFLDKTKMFVENLCKLANKENKEFVMLDQFISSSNPEQCLRYVDDIKTIIVDRDPRDLFINQILCGSHVLPKEPHEFCVMYKHIRKLYGDKCEDSVLKVNFEDMIFHYDEYVKKVVDFVGISETHHTEPKKYFNPSESATRTKLWKKYPQFKNQIRVIENEIPEWLYLFPDNVEFEETIDSSSNNHHLLGKS